MLYIVRFVNISMSLFEEKVAAFMAKNVPSVRKDECAENAIKLMKKHNHRLITVINDAGAVIGIIRARGLIKLFSVQSAGLKMIVSEEAFIQNQKMPVSEIMNSPPIVLDENDKLSEALTIFAKNDQDIIAIVDKDMKPVGVLDIQDIFTAAR